jgi:hypothetical protein
MSGVEGRFDDVLIKGREETNRSLEATVDQAKHMSISLLVPLLEGKTVPNLWTCA